MDSANKLISTAKHADVLLSIPGIKQGPDSRRMSSSLRQSITARRVSHGGAVTTLFTEELAVERGASTQQSITRSGSSDTSRRSSTAAGLAVPKPPTRRMSRCLHEIQVQPRVPQRTLSQHQLLLLTPFGSSTPVITPSASRRPSCKSSELSSGLLSTSANSSSPSQLSDGPERQGTSLSSRSAQLPSSPSKSEGLLLSVDMARSASMPTFTARENQASTAKDAALGINRGESYVWLDDGSTSDQEGEIALITPMEEPKTAAQQAYSDVQTRFSEYTWDRAGPPLFANPFEKSGHATPPVILSGPSPHETSPGRVGRESEKPRQHSQLSDPPSPTHRPAILRYRSSPDLHAQDPAGLNIMLSASPNHASPSSWYRSIAGSVSSSDEGKTGGSSSKMSVSESGSVVLMSRSAEHAGASTLDSLLPRLSYAPLALQGTDIPSSYKRSTSGSRRGSWAQLNVVDFSPPAVTLGRNYRERFNSVDSALQRSSDAASVFESFQGAHWMRAAPSKNREWTRRSTDWSVSSSRRGSDPNARRRSSLARTAYTNLHLTRPSSISSPASAPSMESAHYDQAHLDSSAPGPSRGFRFGSAVAGLSPLVAPDPVLREVDEGTEHPDWYTRRGSWAEV